VPVKMVEGLGKAPAYDMLDDQHCCVVDTSLIDVTNRHTYD
jgi:hypothetical protein